MFLSFVYFVFMCLFVIKTEGNIIKIEIKAKDQGACTVPREIKLTDDRKYSLEVKSDYFIIGTHWNHKSKNKYLETFSLNFERTIQSGANVTNTHTFIYKYSQTHNKVKKNFEGEWNFLFKLLMNFDPWSSRNQIQIRNFSTCSSTVKIVERLNRPSLESSARNNGTSSTGGSYKFWATIIVPIIGILFIVQSVYVIIGKIRRRASIRRKNDEDPISPKSPQTRRDSKTRMNIADRPPLPLPPDEVTKEEFSSPASPVPKRHHHLAAKAPSIPVQNIYNDTPAHDPLASKQSYSNKGLNTSDEQVKSPGFSRRQIEDSSVPNQFYRNNALDNSDDEPMSPSCARRQIQAKLGPLVPQKQVCASKSFKNPKPLPREPPQPPEMAPAFHPALREDYRSSDADWQYEMLEPSYRYLNR